MNSYGRLVLFAAAAAVAFLISGCGGGAGGSSKGSIPVKTITEPTRTVTYSVPSSAMEPTIHCAEPAQGCEAAVGDGVVVQEPVRDPTAGTIRSAGMYSSSRRPARGRSATPRTRERSSSSG